MGEVCRTPDALRAAFAKVVSEKVDHAIAQAQREATVYAFSMVVSGKFTWSRWQPNDVWSGQARQSVNVSYGTIDRSYAPDNPGDWPLHQSPYPPRDPFEAAFALEGMPAYGMSYVSDAAPHMQNVEMHTGVMRFAAEATKAHFAPGYQWGAVLTKAADVPF